MLLQMAALTGTLTATLMGTLMGTLTGTLTVTLTGTPMVTLAGHSNPRGQDYGRRAKTNAINRTGHRVVTSAVCGTGCVLSPLQSAAQVAC